MSEVSEQQRKKDYDWIIRKRVARYGKGDGFWHDTLLEYSKQIGWPTVFDSNNNRGNTFIKKVECIFQEYSPYNPPKPKHNGGNAKENSDYLVLKNAKISFLGSSSKNHKRYPELINIAACTEWDGFFSKDWSDIIRIKKAKKYLDYCQKAGFISDNKNNVFGINIQNWFLSMYRTNKSKKAILEIKKILPDYTFEGVEKIFKIPKATGSIRQFERAQELHVYISKFGLLKYSKSRVKSKENALISFLQSLKKAYQNNDFYGTVRLYPDTKEFLLKHGYLK